MKAYLTTLDNPYDPSDDFTRWFLYDVHQGYNSCSYLARVAKTSDALSESENLVEIEHAIDEIVKYDLTGNYVKILR